MTLLVTTTTRYKSERPSVPHLRWVNGEPFVLPKERNSKKTFRSRIRSARWSIALLLVFCTLVFGLWSVLAGGNDQDSALAAAARAQPPPAIQWVTVAAGAVRTPVPVSGPKSAPIFLAPGSPTQLTPQGTSTEEPEEVAARISEADLSERVSASFNGRTIEGTPRGTVTIQALGVRLRDPYLITEGSVRVGILSLPVGFSATVTVNAGQPFIVVQTATVANTVVPEEIRARTQRVVQRFADEMLASEKVHLTSLTVADGELVATGIRI